MNKSNDNDNDNDNFQSMKSPVELNNLFLAFLTRSIEILISTSNFASKLCNMFSCRSLALEAYWLYLSQSLNNKKLNLVAFFWPTR